MKSKRGGGFTLLELLITLSLFSIIMVVVSSVFGTGISVWRRGEGESEVYQELRLTLSRMAVELRNAIPYEGTPFEGKKDLLSFAQVRSSRSSSLPEWVQITYEVKKSSGTVHLVRRINPFLKGEETEDILISHFSDIHFSYPFFEAEGEWIWKEDWIPPDESKEPPPFVRMELSLDGAERWEKVFLIPMGTKGEGHPPPE